VSVKKEKLPKYYVLYASQYFPILPNTSQLFPIILNYSQLFPIIQILFWELGKNFTQLI
jgi:hypothetical protein